MTTGTRLFVSNLPEHTSENDLKNVFSSYGEILSVDLKHKQSVDNNSSKFAFVTLSASNFDIEACIKRFSKEDFKGNKLFVTRARESFLERLQRERQEANKKVTEQTNHIESLPKRNPVIKLGENLNPRKRQIENVSNDINNHKSHKTVNKFDSKRNSTLPNVHHGDVPSEAPLSSSDRKKHDSEKKRLESIKKKRMEFKMKQKIIKTGLVGIDIVPNKKTIFSDDEEISPGRPSTNHALTQNNKSNLFDDDESDNDVNFEIKRQFEGKKGQKVLDLQSRYKSDKRFVLDERFVEDNPSEDEKKENEGIGSDTEDVELGQADEKNKQLNILQDLLGVPIKSTRGGPDMNKKTKSMGMLRFDPLQPEHSKFLATVETKEQPSKKSKKKKKIDEPEPKLDNQVTENQEKVEVSQEQFYSVSETLKEAIAHQADNTFSLRSLFGKSTEDNETETVEQEDNYIPLQSSKDKVKNPLDPTGKTPFIYDSSDSETEEKDDIKHDMLPENSNTKAVWKENLFFTKCDNRFIEGLEFFNKTEGNEVHKERRELKSLMKKRLYNKERKTQMFQKKIGGRKKMRNGYRKKK